MRVVRSYIFFRLIADGPQTTSTVGLWGCVSNGCPCPASLPLDFSGQFLSAQDCFDNIVGRMEGLSKVHEVKKGDYFSAYKNVDGVSVRSKKH